MAVTIGKRKRERGDESSRSGSEDEATMRALFQKAFEAKFKPLPYAEPQHQSDEEGEDDDLSELSDDSDEWVGLSDEDGAVQIISHAQIGDNDHINEAHERKMFMSSKPPTSARASVRSIKPDNVDPEEDSTEKTNLKNDLALQRLLKESHLLNSSSFSGKVAAPEGKSRIKSLDLRIQDLGAKKSISEQQKMPLSHRKGISSKAVGREEKRRKEATENGVVLERAKAAKPTSKKRERSVGGPTVGKFKGGTLKLSSKDVKSIQGPKKRDSGRKKGRR